MSIVHHKALGKVNGPHRSRTTQKDIAGSRTPGAQRMNTTTARALTFAAALAVMSGCQSGPRWAWWKHDDAPTDTSAIARTADPQLPSAQTTPQPVAVAGLQPAASPSSTNIASAAGTTTAPTATTPMGTPSTIANAPLANYASAGAMADKLTAPSTTAPATASAAGPYDPNGYRPSTAVASTTSGDSGTASADRYGITPIGGAPPATTAPQRTAENVPAVQPTTTAAAGDRYGLGTPATATTPQTVASLTASPSTPRVAAPAATTTVQTPSPGQYRPGGTSTYVGTSPAQYTEIATRPAPVAPSPYATAPTAVAPTTAPSTGSEPWAPPATTSPSVGSRY
jgi:hypothetical protein